MAEEEEEEEEMEEDEEMQVEFMERGQAAAQQDEDDVTFSLRKYNPAVSSRNGEKIIQLCFMCLCYRPIDL